MQIQGLLWHRYSRNSRRFKRYVVRTQKQISKWAKADSSFAGFTCLGKYRPSITLDEFIEIKGRIQSNPLEFWTEKEKSNFVRDPPLVSAINHGNLDIAKLKAIDRIVEYIYGHETDTLKRLLFYGFRSPEQTCLYKRKLYQRNQRNDLES